MLGLVHTYGTKTRYFCAPESCRIEQMRDAQRLSLYCTLLLLHGELGWHLAVRYHSDATSHIKTEFHFVTLLHKDSTSSLVDIISPSRCKIPCAIHTKMFKMHVHSLPMSPGASEYYYELKFIIYIYIVKINNQ
jgi:hypothetical protein